MVNKTDHPYYCFLLDGRTGEILAQMTIQAPDKERAACVFGDEQGATFAPGRVLFVRTPEELYWCLDHNPHAHHKEAQGQFPIRDEIKEHIYTFLAERESVATVDTISYWTTYSTQRIDQALYALCEEGRVTMTFDKDSRALYSAVAKGEEHP